MKIRDAFINNSDADWERYGKLDPYFGVISNDQYRSANIDDDAKERFFASGGQHIECVLKNVSDHLAPGFCPTRALDFGCGVGRLLLPLSSIAEEVVGIDISKSMIDEARVNCDQRGVTNVQFASELDELPPGAEFDFIHSFIVFQHMPVAKGEQIFRGLLERLSVGGIGALHFTYHAPQHARVVHWSLRNIPFAGNVYNLLLGRSLTYPLMQSNFYDVNKLLHILQSENCSKVYLNFTFHKRNSGIMLYFQKDAAPKPE